MALTLVIANKAYSSWSFRPWIVMRQFGMEFSEIVIPMAQEATRAEMLRYAPTGKCPSLHDGAIAVWDSLAIIEYLAETFPDQAIWPRDKAARAQARALAAEMHSEFMAVRQHLPMNVRRKPAPLDLAPEVAADVARIEAAFAAARGNSAQVAPSCSVSFRPPMRCSRRSSIVFMSIAFRSRRSRAPTWMQCARCRPRAMAG